MPRTGRLVALGAATLVVGLVLLFPARALHHWFSPPALQLAGIEGSAWSGTAREASYNGLYLRHLRWNMRPWKIFLGQLAFKVEAEPAGGFLEANLAAGLTGKLYLSELRAGLPIAAVGQLLPTGDVAGDITLNIDELELADGWPTQLHGEVAVANLLVPALAPDAIGDFRAELQTTDEGIVGSVEDASGMLDVAATLQLGNDRSYTLAGQVGATTTATPGVVQQLRFLGSPDERGLRNFRLEGRL